MLAVLGNLMPTPSPWTPKLSAKRIQRDKVCSARVRERERELQECNIAHALLLSAVIFSLLIFSLCLSPYVWTKLLPYIDVCCLNYLSRSHSLSLPIWIFRVRLCSRPLIWLGSVDRNPRGILMMRLWGIASIRSPLITF